MIIEASTSPAELADTPAAVFIWPKTSHGWRPISVKIQPNEFASSGSSGSAITDHSSARRLPPVRLMPSGSPFRRLRHSTHSAMIAISADSRPMPIMSRKLQYVTGMIGVYEPGP